MVIGQTRAQAECTRCEFTAEVQQQASTASQRSPGPGQRGVLMGTPSFRHVVWGTRRLSQPPDCVDDPPALGHPNELKQVDVAMAEAGCARDPSAQV